MNESIIESDIFKYKVGREELNIDDFSQINFVDSLIVGEFDLCRIKLFGGKKDLLQQLNNLGYPYEIYTINYYNFLRVKDKPALIRDKIFSTREVFLPKEDQEFQEILEEVLENNDWVEFKSTLSNNLMPIKLRKELAMNYYSSFSSSLRKNTYTGILNKEGKGIGLFMGEFKDNSFHGAIFGLKNESKSKGYAKYFYDFMCEICHEKGIEYFVDEVNIFNIASQRSASSQNLVPQKIYFNISIFPFYDYKNKVVCEINLVEFKFSAVISYLENHFENYTINEVKVKALNTSEYLEANRLIKLCPVYTKADVFFVFHFLYNETIQESYYVYLAQKIK